MGNRSRSRGRSRRETCGHRGTTRAQALCAQVRHELEWALGLLGDERLNDLSVEAVLPHPNVSRMLVVLRPSSPSGEGGAHGLENRERILSALHGAEGLLRSWIAGAIHRKRTPHLAFLVLDPGSLPVDPEDMTS